MGRRPRAAWVHVELYHDEGTGAYTIEVNEWRRGSAARLSAFLELDSVDDQRAEKQALQDYAASAVEWLYGDALRLDSTRML